MVVDCAFLQSFYFVCALFQSSAPPKNQTLIEGACGKKPQVTSNSDKLIDYPSTSLVFTLVGESDVTSRVT